MAWNQLTLSGTPSISALVRGRQFQYSATNYHAKGLQLEPLLSFIGEKKRMLKEIRKHYTELINSSMDPLMALNAVMAQFYGIEYRQPLNELLQFNNAKTSKGEKKGFLTGILYLIPATGSGVNLCAMSQLAGCESGCLNTAGRGRFNTTQLARMRKTLLLALDPVLFGELLRKDIDRLVKQATNKGFQPCLRLNGTSDTDWFKRYPEILQSAIDQGVKVYDYTKIPRHIYTKHDQYHLTLSYSEHNPAYTKLILECAALYPEINLAVVFRDKLPDNFLGRPVIDGDETDLRFLDPSGVVIGLKAKGRAKQDQSGFVVDW
jgi:hypothetical protein